MPGSTPVLGIPYPFSGEPVGPADFQNFANAVDALVNTDETTVAGLIDPPLAWVTAGAGFAAAQNVETTATWTIEIYDNDTMFVAGTPDRLTINTAGVYMVSIEAGLSGFATITSFRVGVFQNGTRRFAERKGDDAGAHNYSTSLCGLVACNVADFLQLRVLWTGTGGPATIESARMITHRVCPL